LRATGSEVGSLLEKAYSMSQQVSQDTVTHFLSNLCDAFAMVAGEEMVITEDSATLGAMLSRSPANSSRPFIDYVDYEDRDRLREHFQVFCKTPSVQQCTTSSLKVKLLDDLSCPVEVLLFFAKLWGPDGDDMHFLGISRAWKAKPSTSARSSRNGVRSRSSMAKLAGSHESPSQKDIFANLRFSEPILSDSASTHHGARITWESQAQARSAPRGGGARHRGDSPRSGGARQRGDSPKQGRFAPQDSGSRPRFEEALDGAVIRRHKESYLYRDVLSTET